MKIKKNIGIKLGSKFITKQSRPYLIAEIGVNHEGSLDNAKKLIDLAKEGGANAAKFQSYKANKIASKNSPSYWDTTKESTKSQYELFKKYDSFEESDYIELSNHCKNIGIDFLSTPFDDFAIDFLDNIVPFFKIASADITSIPFLRKIAKKGKPVILSTGASNLKEINFAISTLNQEGCNSIALLHCILNYPTSNNNAHLSMIKSLIKNYPNYIVGYSDHTLPDKNMTSLIASFLLGAVIIEKHFTNDKSLPGNDHYHAMDIKDLKRFNELIDINCGLIGDIFEKKPIASEEISRLNARRSIVAKNILKKGHVITEEDITYKRPGNGISPIYWDKVLGMRLSQDIESDHIIQWEDLNE